MSRYGQSGAGDALPTHPTRATVVNRTLLLVAALLGIAVIAGLAFVGHLDKLTRPGLLFLVVAPSAVALTLAYVAIRQPERVARWRPQRIGPRLAGELSLLGGTLVGVEMLLAIWGPDSSSPQMRRKIAADKLGLPFDTRTYSEVVAQLRDRGIDALPGISRAWPRRSSVQERLPSGFFPLSHASLASVVECNESGEYLVYQTDEFGLNNPRGLLASGRISIATVGESHALGHCVPASHSVVGLLRRVYPRTANFAMAGGSTLSTLASFREYVEPLQPPLVLWFVNPHDLLVEDEFKDPVLVRYLDPGFSQRLLERQAEVDRLLRSLAIGVQAELDRESRLATDRANDFSRILLLSRLREQQYIHLWRSAKGASDPALFLRALTLAKETARQWGGSLVLVISPSYAEVVGKQMSIARKQDMKDALAARQIPVVDGAALFLGQPDPAGLFRMRIANHPTPEGNALLVNHLVQELARRFPQGLADLR
jgi:hypothetical protein